MNAKQSDSSAPRDFLKRFLRPLQGRGALVVGGIAAVVLVLVGLRAAWSRWGGVVTEREQYTVRAEHIEVTPQPDWIRADVKSEVVRDLQSLSLLDPQLTVSVARSFKLHPWVADVTRVRKKPGPQVLVELRYRRPVAWVEVPGKFFPAIDTERGLLPVDAESFVLPPQDFSKEQAGDYLRIWVGETIPSGLVGTPWGETRVAGAAQIAGLLTDVWRLVGIYRITLSEDSGENGPEPVYELLARTGTRIIWGHAPGHESSDEAAAQDKLAVLKVLAERDPPLPSVESAPVLDLRRPETLAQLAQ